MRSSKSSSTFTGSTLRDPRQGALRALKFAAIALGVGLVMSAGAARAGDDEEDDMTFEEKIIDNLMSGLGAKSMQKPGIDYRERSPLVVPPKLDLPPPAEAEAKAAPNWPKDPDEKRRKEAAADRKKQRKLTPQESARALSPSELNAVKTPAATREVGDSIQPGVTSNPSMSPSQLGYSGSLFGMFKGNSGEEKKFTSEPPRGSLVDPPPGYQTPSPNYAYGSGPDNSRRTYYDIQSGKEKTQ
jgi:hypothetical protein